MQFVFIHSVYYFLVIFCVGEFVVGEFTGYRWSGRSWTHDLPHENPMLNQLSHRNEMEFLSLS